jgi:hypothetical protein
MAFMSYTFCTCYSLRDPSLTLSSGLLYASTSLQGDAGFQLLRRAVEALTSSVDVAPHPTVLWSVQYEKCSNITDPSSAQTPDAHILEFSGSSLDLAFDESKLDRVRDVWQKIVGDDAGQFLVFEDREGNRDDDEE